MDHEALRSRPGALLLPQNLVCIGSGCIAYAVQFNNAGISLQQVQVAGLQALFLFVNFVASISRSVDALYNESYPLSLLLLGKI